jgi:hypothetical protein
MSEKPFRKIVLVILSSLSILCPVSGLAEETLTNPGTSEIRILSPKENEVLPPDHEVKIDYQFIRGLKDQGEHLHVYLDGKTRGPANARRELSAS